MITLECFGGAEVGIGWSSASAVSAPPSHDMAAAYGKGVRTIRSRGRAQPDTRVDRQSPPAIFRRLRDLGLPADVRQAPVAELVDALDSKSSSARSAGSIPARGTRRPSALVRRRSFPSIKTGLSRISVCAAVRRVFLVSGEFHGIFYGSLWGSWYRDFWVESNPCRSRTTATFVI
jgi:hypothetical protein